MTPSAFRTGVIRRMALARGGDDRGVALVTALVVMMVLTALGATVALIGINNMKNASRDRQAGSSLGAGDAGVATAIEFIRSSGTSTLNCPESNPASCSTNPAGWSNPTNPQLVPLDDAGIGCNTGQHDCARVWVGVVQQAAPPTIKESIYNIHSSGIYGPGPSVRQIVATVRVFPDKFPIGVFGETVYGNGNTSLYTESLFSRNCIYPIQTQNGNSNGIRFTGNDSYWGMPAAAHTTSHISTKNNCTDSTGFISSPAPVNAASANHCTTDPTLVANQSVDGGLVSSTAGAACYDLVTRADGTHYPDAVCPSGVSATLSNGLCDTTSFGPSDLQRYGYRPRGLTDAQYAALKARAQNTGTYNVAPSTLAASLTSALNAGVVDPVVYWDCSVSNPGCTNLSGGQGYGVSLSLSQFPANTFQFDPTANQACPRPMQILTVVVEHGNLYYQAGNNTWTDAAFFVPDGTYTGGGGFNVDGTMFSNNVTLGGNQGFDLDACWVTNFPGALLNVVQSGFREDDSKDAP